MKNVFLRPATLSYLGVIMFLFFANPIIADNESDDVVAFYCPRDYWVTCTDEIWNLEIYGSAWTEGGGQIQHISPYNTSYYIDNTCGTGRVVRHFKAFVNHQWVACDQTIWVEPSSPFNGHYIEWPRDTVLYGCNPNTDPYVLGYKHGFPHWNDVDCSFVGYSYKDEIVTFGNTCDKVIRHWSVIDWCSYQPNSAYPSGLWTHDQIIKITDGVIPEAVVPPDVKASNQTCHGAYVHVDKFIIIEETTCGDEYEIRNDSPYADTQGPDASGSYPLGKTCFHYFVNYGCGGNRTYTVCVNVEDKLPPAPICVEKLAIALMPIDTDGDGMTDDGMVEIWASDFDYKSYDVCDNKPLIFSFSPDIEDNVRQFSCENIGLNFLDMWVTDEKGNQAFCKVQLDVQNNNANIPNCSVFVPGAQLSGMLYSYPEMAKVSNQSIAITAIAYDTIHSGSLDTLISNGAVIDSFFNVFSNAYSYTYVQDTSIVDTRNTEIVDLVKKDTATIGFYHFTEVLRHHNNMLEISQQQSNNKAINASDLVALRKHLSGEELLMNPIALLAADLNNDEVVDDKDEKILKAFVYKERFSLPTVFPVKIVAVDMNGEVVNVKSEDMPYYFSMVGIDTIVMDFVIYQKGNITTTKVSLPVDIVARTNYDLDKKHNYSVYPNPFSDRINISASHVSDNSIRFVLLDIDGKVIFEKNSILTNKALEVELNEMKAGIYFYSITEGNNVEQGKLIKIK